MYDVDVIRWAVKIFLYVSFITCIYAGVYYLANYIETKSSELSEGQETITEEVIEEGATAEPVVKIIKESPTDVNITVPVTVNFSLFDLGVGVALLSGGVAAVRFFKKRKKKVNVVYEDSE